MTSLRALIAALIVVAHPLAATATTPAMPELQTGDLVFQTSRSSQSDAIRAATESPYSHVGLVVARDGQLEVLEAISRVSRTPLKRWIDRGSGGRVTVLRDPRLTPAQRDVIAAEAARYLGHRYDPWFLFDNREIYCSELVYLAYRASGIELGQVERLRDLRLGDQIVRKLVAERARSHPLCRGVKRQVCTSRLLDQRLITPQSLAEDPSLTRVFSNYAP